MPATCSNPDDLQAIMPPRREGNDFARRQALCAGTEPGHVSLDHSKSGLFILKTTMFARIETFAWRRRKAWETDNERVTPELTCRAFWLGLICGLAMPRLTESRRCAGPTAMPPLKGAFHHDNDSRDISV